MNIVVRGTAAPLGSSVRQAVGFKRSAAAHASMSSFPKGPGSEDLVAKSCAGQCGPDTPKLTPEQLDQYMPALPTWQLNTDKTAISRSFVAKNFVAAVEFFNQVKDVAETEGHHPDLHLTDYRNVVVHMSTHAVGGLTMPDLVVAAKIDDIEVKYSPKWLKQQTSVE
eukprot:jgi/Ulvmu1/5960/UM026_0083.1